MSSDDQYFFDLLASVPRDLLNYGGQVAEYIERHSNSLAAELREAIESSQWIPDSLRPPVNEAYHHHVAPPPPRGLLAKAGSWLSRNRTVVAVVVAFAGTTAILIHTRHKAHVKKRRARRDRRGKKTEIVVLAGSSLLDPLTKSLALDLDRRGYIVYMTVSSAEEDALVRTEHKTDIQPLWMDLTSSVPLPGLDVHPNLEPLRQLIQISSRSSSPASSSSSRLSPGLHRLAGLVILLGSTGYPTGPLLTLPPTDLVDTINTRLLSPVLTIQQFLPLLNLASSQNEGQPKPPHPVHSPSIILAYPSIPTALNLPTETPQTLTTASLSSLATSLRHECALLHHSPIRITELKLGNFDLSLPSPKAGDFVYPRSSGHSSDIHQRSSALTHWHSSQRTAAQRAQDSQSQSQSPSPSPPRRSPTGSSLREFHNAVFDALNPSPSLRYYTFGLTPASTSTGAGLGSGLGGTIYVGRGARTYALLGKYTPEGILRWLIRRRGLVDASYNPGGNGYGNGNGYGHASDTDPSPLARERRINPDDSGDGKEKEMARSPVEGGPDASAAGHPGSQWGVRSAGSASSAWEQV